MRRGAGGWGAAGRAAVQRGARRAGGEGRGRPRGYLIERTEESMSAADGPGLGKPVVGLSSAGGRGSPRKAATGGGPRRWADGPAEPAVAVQVGTGGGPGCEDSEGWRRRGAGGVARRGRRRLDRQPAGWWGGGPVGWRPPRRSTVGRPCRSGGGDSAASRRRPRGAGRWAGVGKAGPGWRATEDPGPLGRADSDPTGPIPRRCRLGSAGAARVMGPEGSVSGPCFTGSSVAGRVGSRREARAGCPEEDGVEWH
jgi:hypothetical protein